MTLFLIGMLMVNALGGLAMYIIMYKKRKVFSDHFGMIMATCSSGILSFNIAMLIYFLFPLHLSYISFVTTMIGGLIGILFGSLVKFQSLLSGFFQGVVGGMMGTMLSAVIQNPSLCSLPSSYINNIEQNMIAFSLFATVVMFITMGLLYYSLKV
jgi:hypothetical protein